MREGDDGSWKLFGGSLQRSEASYNRTMRLLWNKYAADLNTLEGLVDEGKYSKWSAQLEQR